MGLLKSGSRIVKRGGENPFKNVVFLLRAGDPDSNNFTDVSNSSNPLTGTGSPVIATNGYFGASSKKITFNGNGYCYLFSNRSQDFAFGTGDFNIRLFAKWNPGAYMGFYDAALISTYFEGAGNYGWKFYISYEGKLGFADYGNNNPQRIRFEESGTRTANVYQYLGVQRKSGTLSLWADGVKLAETTTPFDDDYPSNANSLLRVATQYYQVFGAGHPLASFNGELDENIEIMKGATRDLSVVPTMPFPAS